MSTRLPFDSLPPDEAEMWGELIASLRSKGATHEEAVYAANLLLTVYCRRKRRAPTSRAGSGALRSDK